MHDRLLLLCALPLLLALGLPGVALAVDLDQDGADDLTDNCPIPNPSQADRDGDGVGDLCDFDPLGFAVLPRLPGGGTFTEVHDLSDDRRVLVGASDDASGRRAVVWNDFVPTAIDLPDFFVVPSARGVSADGSTVVGIDSTANTATFVFRGGEVSWSRTPCPSPGGGLTAVNQNGSEIAGGLRWPLIESPLTCTPGNVPVITQGHPSPFSGGEWLGPLFDFAAPEGEVNDLVTRANDTIAVGRRSDLGAALWIIQPYPLYTVTVILPGIEAHALSLNENQTTVGQANGKAVLWNGGLFPVTLGTLGGTTPEFAKAIDASGRTIVGTGSRESEARAFLWTPEDGMRALSEVLEGDHGFNLEGWTLTDATAISPDGRTIVGNGVDPLGNPSGWIAQLGQPAAVPGPAAAGPGILGALLFATGLWRIREGIPRDRRRPPR